MFTPHRRKKNRNKYNPHVNAVVAIVIILSAGLALFLYLASNVKPINESKEITIRDARTMAYEPGEPDYHFQSSHFSFPLKGLHGEWVLSLGTIECVTLSPDGEFAAAACANGILVWDIQNKPDTPLYYFIGKTRPIINLRFSDNNKYLFVLDKEAQNHVLDLEQGRETFAFKSQTPISIHSIQMSMDIHPQGHALAVVGGNMFAKVWDITSNQCLHAFRCTGQPHSIDFSPDGNTLLTAGLDLHKLHRRPITEQKKELNIIELWDLTSNEKIKTITCQEGIIFIAAFSNDGAHIVAAGKENVRILDKTTGDTIKNIQFRLPPPLSSHNQLDPFAAVELFRQSFSTLSMKKDRFFYYASPYSYPIILDFNSNTFEEYKASGDLRKAQISLSEDWSKILISKNENLYLSNMKSGKKLWHFGSFGSYPTHAEFSEEESSTVKLTSREGLVKTWDIKTGKLLEESKTARLKNTPQYRNNFGHAPNQKYWLQEDRSLNQQTGKLESTFSIMDMTNNQTMDAFNPILDKAIGAQLLDTGNTLLLCSEDGKLEIWDVDTQTIKNKLILNSFTQISDAWIKPLLNTNRIFIVVDGVKEDGFFHYAVIILNRNTMSLEYIDIDIQGLRYIHISNNGLWVAFAADNFCVMNINTKELKQADNIRLNDITFSNTHKFAFVSFHEANQRGYTRDALWDLKTMEMVHEFNQILSYPKIIFSSDDSMLLTIDSNGVTKVWDIKALLK